MSNTAIMRKIILLWICLSISMAMAMPVASFFKQVGRENIEHCESHWVTNNEAYYECLEQGDLSQWDMNHKELSLNIEWHVSFWFIFIFFGIIFFGTSYALISDNTWWFD